MYPGRFEHLRLYALDPYDLILSKLERNSQNDRDDVAVLAGSLHLSRDWLREGDQKELHPYLANESRHDLTVELWPDICFEGHPLDPKEKKTPMV